MSQKFRRDLYYRLNVLTLTLPNLNERDADILRLAAFFIDEHCENFQKKPVAISDGACALLMGRHWDGNIRELRNACECLVVLNKNGVISAADVEKVFDDGGIQPRRDSDLTETSSAEFRLFHQERVLKALADNQGDKAGAARQLGISRTTLWRRMKKFSIEA